MKVKYEEFEYDVFVFGFDLEFEMNEEFLGDRGLGDKYFV